MVNAERVISNAIVSVLRENVFYGHIIAQLPKVFTTEIPTMAVGRKGNGLLVSLYVNPEYVNGVYERASSKDSAFAHVCEVIKHEILHVVFRHLFLKPMSDKHAQDTACELAVNSYINRKSLIDPGVFPEDFKLPEKLSMLDYYEQLSKKQKKGKGGQQGQGNGKGGQQGQGNSNDGQGEDQGEEGEGKGEESKGKGKGKKSRDKDQGKDGQAQGGEGNENGEKGDDGGQAQGGEGANTLDSHEVWNGLADDEMTKLVIKDVMRKAMESAKRSNQWGSVPSGVAREVEDALEEREAVVPWETILRNFVASSSETELDYTMRRPSKRFGTRPGTKKEDRIRLAVGIDTSGSISAEALSMFANELYWIARNNVDVDVFECDTQIHREYPFSDFEPSEIKGGGGTDLEPVIKEAYERGYDACIYFTDAYAPKINEPYPIPLVFVVDTMYGKVERENLPHPCDFVFYVADGKVSVE